VGVFGDVVATPDVVGVSGPSIGLAPRHRPCSTFARGSPLLFTPATCFLSLVSPVRPQPGHEPSPADGRPRLRASAATLWRSAGSPRWGGPIDAAYASTLSAPCASLGSRVLAASRGAYAGERPRLASGAPAGMLAQSRTRATTVGAAESGCGSAMREHGVGETDTRSEP
jgi:hypothetical protein